MNMLLVFLFQELSEYLHKLSLHLAALSSVRHKQTDVDTTLKYHERLGHQQVFEFEPFHCHCCM